MKWANEHEIKNERGEGKNKARKITNKTKNQKDRNLRPEKLMKSGTRNLTDFRRWLGNLLSIRSSG